MKRERKSMMGVVGRDGGAARAYGGAEGNEVVEAFLPLGRL